MPGVPEPDRLEETNLAELPTCDLGDAVEEYIELTETTGKAPDLNQFLAKYPDIADELRSSLEGLAMVTGLLGSGSSSPFGGSGDAELLAQSEPLMPGCSLAGYRIVRELGYGGMGVVYEAVHVDLDRPVALKILRPWSGGSARRRFLNEARTAASLHHTNIVPVFDVGQSGTTSYYAMQKIDGEGLDRWIRRHRGDPNARRDPAGAVAVKTKQTASDLSSTIPANDPDTPGQTSSQNQPAATARKRTESQSASDTSQNRSSNTSRDRTPPLPDSAAYSRWVAQIGSQAALALDYAHKKQVIHRDIKPSNLILDESGTIWVADFGLALRLDDPNLSRGDGVLGTPRYTSPEQAARKVVDHRTDIYSLGATLYELLTLRPPYDGDSSDEVIRKILSESAPLPRTMVPHLSLDLETIIIKAMSRRPEDRYATAGEMAEDLLRFLNFEPVKARRIGPGGRLWRLARRHPAVSTVTVVATTVILCIAAFAYRRVALERDDALLARFETLVALNGEKHALEKAKSAMRNQLWREASIVRLSAVPDRRRTIMDLVKEALVYDPEPELRKKLRDEVVQALSLNDVRQEIPLVQERVAGFEVINGGKSAASVSEDGRTMTLWDIETQQKTAEVLLDSLFDPSGVNQAQNSGFGQPGRGFEGISGGPLSRRSVRVLVPVGSQLGVLRPDRRGILWIDSRTAELRSSWTPPEQGIIWAALPIGNQSKILTIENYPGAGADVKRSSERGQPPGMFAPDDELRILLYDLEKPDSKPVLLDKFRPAAERGRFIWPILSASPDGTWVAMSRLFEEQIRILDAADGKELSTFPAQVPVTSMTAGPDRLLAVAGGGSIRLWQNEPKKDSEQSAWSTVALPSFGTHLGSIRQIRFSPDGNTIAASGRTSGIELWDIKSGEPVATLATVGQVDHLAFADSSGKLLASMDDPRNGGLRVWSIDKPVAKRYLSTLPDNVASMAVLNTGGKETLFAHLGNGQVWFECDDAQVMKPLSLDAKSDRFGTVQSDRQNRLWLFSGSDAMAWKDWNTRQTELPKPTESFSLPDFTGLGWSFRAFGLTRIFAGLSFTDDANRAVLSRGSMICLMDRSLAKGFLPIVPDSFLDQVNQRMLEGGRAPITNDEPRKDSDERKDFDSSKRNPLAGKGDRDGERGRRPPPPDNFPPASGFRGSSFARRSVITSDGKGVVVLRGDTCEYWDIGDLQQSPLGEVWSAKLRPLPDGVPEQGLNALAISPDDQWLALGTQDGRLIVVSIPKWRVVLESSFQLKPESDPESITDLSFRPGDRPMLAVAGRHGIAIWSLTPRPEHYLNLPLDNNSYTPAAWDAQGNSIFLVDDQKHVLKFDLQAILENISELDLSD